MAHLTISNNKNYNNKSESDNKGVSHTSSHIGKYDISKQTDFLLNNNYKIMQSMLSQDFQMFMLPKGEKAISAEHLMNFIQKKNVEIVTLSLASNVLSPQQIVNLGFDKDYQKFNTRHFKSVLSFLKGTDFIDDSDESEFDDDENSIGDVSESDFLGVFDVRTQIKDTKLSDADMSLGGDKIHKQKHITAVVHQKPLGILTHDLSKKCIEFIKNQGHKNYYNDIYLRFHKDDIIKTAYILDDVKLYDYLLQTGQITAEELKKLPILGQNKTASMAHYDTLITPEFMCQFLDSQKLINVHLYDDFMNIFKEKQWFHTGAMQLLIQIIGGDYIVIDEVSFFMKWYIDHIEEFNKLFDYFDIEGDYSVTREREADNMRSKHITADSIKAFYLNGYFDTLTSADDPLPTDFFVLDFDKIVTNGFYSGLSYFDYLGLHGIDAETIYKRTAFKPKKSMITQELDNADYLFNSVL